jgi:RHS repeat-associated protein
VSSFGNNLDIQYDALGNITQKTDVGAYGYNVSNNPYAVSEITGYAGAIPSLEQRVTYTSFRRPAAIEEENGYHTSFTYNADWQRVKMEVQHNDSPQLTRYYLGNNYEKDITPGHTVERLYIGGTAYHASAVFIKDDDGAWALHYIIRDHLGSVTGLTDEQGTPVAEYSYDPWGRLRDPQTLQAYALGQEPALLLGRGFTGHEHLPWHGFINMNARLYDPLLGRFLSPDPYVQLPDIVRSYNRYSYCMNNPLMYVDENGEFLLAFLTGFFKGLFSGGAPFKEGWNSVRNEFNIVTGLFKSNMHNSFWQGLWEITSRFTWQMSQTFLGYSMAYTGNVATLVDDVDFYGGATVVKYYGDWGAVTLGSYMNGGETIAADPNNTLFQHEYGHYLQSQAWGWAYLSRAAIPSLFDIFGRDGDHKFHPIEQDANMRAFKYFNEYVEEFYQTESEYLSNSGKGWDFATNPLDIYGNGYDKYVDYRDANQMELVNALKVIPSFLDYISGSLNYITGDAALLFNQLPALIYGFRNHVHYNKHKFRINYKK